MDEIWKNVIGYEELYQVSNKGRIKSLKREGKGIGKGGNKKEIIMKQIPNRSNHFYVKLSNNGVKKSIFVHRIVAKAFPEICGEWFEGCEVHHKDFDTFNNCAENLFVCTKEEHQILHNSSQITSERRSLARKGKKGNPWTEVRRTNMIKKMKNNVKICKPVLQYDLEGNLIKEWPSLNEVERQLGCNHSHITTVCKGERKTAGGFIWKYKN